MYQLLASILKDFRLLLRDKVGLILMFAMPILLVLVITSLQNNTFKIVNEHQVPIVVFNQDGEGLSLQLESALGDVGMFELISNTTSTSTEDFAAVMEQNDALVGLYLPKGFSEKLSSNAEMLTQNTLSDLGVGLGEGNALPEMGVLDVYYSPVLQESYRLAIEGALRSSLKLVQSRKMLNLIYEAINESEMPQEVEESLLHNDVQLSTQLVTKDGSGAIPNATQHNVPAWTIFAMFFMVTSLGSSLVREKRSGSFIRLKTMPGGYLSGIFSKQVVYLFVALLQVLVIFSIGVWVFPLMGLPRLNLPEDLLALFVVSVVSGLCAISYALCLGVFSATEEQTNGFGAVSIVILAALGGILVPSFAMPESFRIFTSISPLYWCLQSYYELFLASGRLADIWASLLPVVLITVVLQALAFAGLKWKNLV